MNKPRIIIIDDNHELSDNLAEILRDQGYDKVTAVYTGEDGVAVSLMDTYDLAIIDVILPGMNGTEVFRALRQLRPNLHGIMMTGYSPDNLLAKASQDGAASILRKPFPIETLLNMVAEFQRDFMSSAAIDDSEIQYGKCLAV